MVNAKKEVLKAYRNNYAIGHFNICNLETFQAVLNASKKTKHPVFMGVSNRSLEYFGLKNITNLMNSLKRSKVILHLDHGNYRNAIDCINAGFPSVMFDGSKFSIKKNVRLTKKVVSHARKYDVLVEGEVGVFEKSGLTRVDEAETFQKQTSVDMLAVSVGNSHGYYKYLPSIDYKRLKNISEALKSPLVFHGASGLKDNVIRTSLKYGVVKVNVDTELRWAFTNQVRDFLKRHSMNKLNSSTFDIRNYLSKGRDAVEKKVVDKIKLFHS